MSENQKVLRKLINLFSNHDKNGGEDVHPNATRTQSGFLSPSDKLKLDTILTPRYLPDGTDLSTLPTGYYNITDAIGKPPESFEGSPCYYEIFRTGLTRYLEGEQIIIRAYQRSSGLTWDKMFYSNAKGNTDKGWSVVLKKERLLTPSEITRLNDGEEVPLNSKLKDFSQVKKFSIDYRFISETKTMEYKKENIISIRDMNITSEVPNKLQFVETNLMFNPETLTLKMGDKLALIWDAENKNFVPFSEKVVIENIYVLWS